MAQRKASVSRDNLRAIRLPEALALHERVQSGAATAEDREVLQRLLMFYRAKFTRGDLSEKTARQLGIA